MLCSWYRPLKYHVCARVLAVQINTLSVCWDLCSSHVLADEPSISPKLIVQYSTVVMVVRFLLKVPCKRDKKCETDEKVAKQR